MTGIIHKLLAGGLALLLVLSFAGGARADGGWVCLQEAQAPYKITVFANGTPLRAGPLDFSVLVQDLETGRTVTDAEVMFKFSPDFPVETSKDGEWLPPCCRLAANTLEGKGRLGVGGNSLLYESRVSLTKPGTWNMDVAVSQGGHAVSAGGKVRIEKAAPPWFVYWPYLAAPFLGVGFLVLNWQARKAGRPGGRPDSRLRVPPLGV